MQHLGVDLADIERTLLIRRAQLANTASWIFNIVCLVVVLGGFAYFLSVQYTWYSATRNLRAEEYGRQLEPFEIETRYGIQGSDNGRGYQAV